MEEAAVFNLPPLVLNLGLTIMGLIGYSLYKVKDHVNKNFKFRIFWSDNIVFWVWAIIAQSLFVVIMTLFPELEIWASEKLIKIIEAIAGQELNLPDGLAPTVIYLTLTWQLSRLANKGAKEKIGVKKSG